METSASFEARSAPSSYPTIGYRGPARTAARDRTGRHQAFEALCHPFRRPTAAYRGSTITLTCDGWLAVR